MATNNSINDPLPTTVPNGGTGLATATTAYGVVCAGTTATGNFQVLNALGSSGDILTSGGAGVLPSFQAPAASTSGLTLIATRTASASSTIDFSNQLTSTYDNYFLVFENVVPGTTQVILQLRVGTGSTPTYQTSSYVGTIAAQQTSGSPGWTGAYGNTASGTGAISMVAAASAASGLTSTSTSAACGHVLITNANNGTNFKTVVGQIGYFTTNCQNYAAFMGQWQSATVITSLRLLMSSGTISTGIFKLYGFSN